MNNLYLCWLNYIGQESDEYNLYEVMFTDDPDTFWSEDDSFEYKPCGLVNGMNPNTSYFKKKIKFKTKSFLELAQNNLCFGFVDVIDGVVALAYESLDGLEEYPEEGRLVLMYGETYEDTMLKLKDKNVEFVRHNEKSQTT